MAGDGPGQPAYDIFSIKRTFLKILTFSLLNSRSLSQILVLFQDALISYCCRLTLIARVAGPLLSRVT